MAVDQHQRALRTQAAQRSGRVARSRGAFRPAKVEAADGRIGAQAIDDAGRVLDALRFDVGAGDDLHGQRAFGFHALDVGAGDVDTDVLRQCRRRRQHGQAACAERIADRYSDFLSLKFHLEDPPGNVYQTMVFRSPFGRHLRHYRTPETPGNEMVRMLQWRLQNCCKYANRADTPRTTR